MDRRRESKKIRFIEIEKGVWRDPTQPALSIETGKWIQYRALSNTRADDVKLPNLETEK